MIESDNYCLLNECQSTNVKAESLGTPSKLEKLKKNEDYKDKVHFHVEKSEKSNTTVASRNVETQRSAADEDRRRTGRYLAVGVTIVMILIAFYHTMKRTTILAGLLAPAIIMLIYVLWLLYFAKKKKSQQVVTV